MVVSYCTARSWCHLNRHEFSYEARWHCAKAAQDSLPSTQRDALIYLDSQKKPVLSVDRNSWSVQMVPSSASSSASSSVSSFAACIFRDGRPMSVVVRWNTIHAGPFLSFSPQHSSSSRSMSLICKHSNMLTSLSLPATDARRDVGMMGCVRIAMSQ